MSNPVGFWIRFLAMILDGILIFIVFGFVNLLLYNSFIVETFTFTDILQLFYFIIIPIVWYGYTVGKKAIGIRIVRMNGDDVTIGVMILRYLMGGIFYAFTCGIGIIVSAFMVGLREDKRSIHNIFADTYVTYDKP